MRRAAILVTALAAAGCGGTDERRAAAPAPPAGDWGPARPGAGVPPRPVAPPLRRPEATVRAALDAGATGVVGIDGEPGVRPRSLPVASDGTLRNLRWERWDGEAARGRGRLRVRDCDPTCATGGEAVVPATVRLSAPRLCGRATYFDRAEVSVPGAAPPASYVRAPC